MTWSPPLIAQWTARCSGARPSSVAALGSVGATAGRPGSWCSAVQQRSRDPHYYDNSAAAAALRLAGFRERSGVRDRSDREGRVRKRLRLAVRVGSLG